MKIQMIQTKQLLALIAGLGLAAWGAGVANAQLVNGNMDAVSISSQLLGTPTGWIATSDNGDGLSSEPWNNVADPGGSGVFFKSFNGTALVPFSAGIYQDVAGSAGVLYSLSGWVGAGPGYSGMTDPATLTQIGLEFLDAGSLVIGGSVLSLGPTELGTVNGNPAGFDYVLYSTQALAPAGTAFVRARFSMIDAYPNGLGDAALVTDMYTLSIVPEPTTCALLGLGLLGLAGMRRRK